MIICTKCGFQNEDSDTFCGSCAGFLEWSGQQVVEEVPEPEPEPEAPVEEEHATFIERVKDRIGIGETKDDVAATNGEVPETTVAAPEPEPVASPVHGTSAPAAPPTVTAPPLTSEPRPAAPAAPEVAPPVEAPASTAREVAPPTSAAAAPPTTAPPTPAPPTPAPPLAAPPTPAPPPAAPSAGATPASAPPTSAAPPAAPPATTPRAPSSVTTPVAAARTAQPGPAQPTAIPPSAATAPVQPEAVKPVATKARPTPRAKVAPTRVVNPGDLICGQCAEGNDPVRKFCRRCGASLVEAQVFTLPWYRRLWRKLTTRRSRAAGDRPKMRRRMIGGAGPGWLTSWVTRIIVLAVIVLVILTFVGPWHHTIRGHITRYYHDAVNVVHPTYSSVHPVAAVASSSVHGHGPGLAIDGVNNSSWQAGAAVTSKKPQTLTVTFAGKTNLDKIGFLNGDQDSPGALLTEPRLHVVRITTPNGYSKTLTLADSASFQRFSIKVKGASALTITIESVYPSGQGTHVALAEVEFFKLKV